MQILFSTKKWGYNIIAPNIKNPPENTTFSIHIYKLDEKKPLNRKHY
jgi:hypothetical protein